MQTALRLETTILPGHRLEVSSPRLPEGVRVELIVVLPDRVGPRPSSALEYLPSPPPDSNQVMLNALARIKEIQNGMKPKADGSNQDYLREARSGAIYGYNPDE